MLRIEDTDRNRHVEDSVQKILSDLRWLGLDWDEGPEVGGDFGPYHQSERLGIYQTHIDRLLAEGGRNVYTIDKAGQKKLIFQSAWRDGSGEVAGLVELSLVLPEGMPHYVRG